MNREKILFIVEGRKTEPRILKSLLGLYGFEDNSIYSYGTSIYSLYKELKEFEETEEIDIVSLLVEREMKFSENERHEICKVPRNEFSEVYLVFDLDSHDTKNTLKNFQKVEEMLEFFDNEFEHGKLFISYPMVESLARYYLRDNLLKIFTFKADTNKNKDNVKFKYICNNHKDSHVLSRILPKNVIEMFKQYHALMSMYLYKLEKIDFKLYRENINRVNTFQIQKNSFLKSQNIVLFSGIIDFILDYFQEQYFPKISFLSEYEIEIIDLWETE